MTDNEIMKALECCQSQGGCKDCPYDGKCCSDDFLKNHLFTDVSELIHRQKANIERLAKENIGLKYDLQLAAEECLVWKSEAIKEFAERLKDDMRLDEECKYNCISCCYECKEFVPQIDNLVKEMTEGKEC